MCLLQYVLYPQLSLQMGPRKTVKSEPSSPGDESRGDNDYQAKRARNNEAVKKSREKAREKAKETTDKVITNFSVIQLPAKTSC